MSWHDYSGGLYFVTICTAAKVHYFGEIGWEVDDPQIKLTAIGDFLSENLQHISEHYSDALVPLFSVMPNHVHALIAIDGSHASHSAKTRMTGTEMQKIAARKGRLSVVVGGLKAAVTKFARAENLPFGWQERYYDHVVRSEEELKNIAHYIKGNVANWLADEER